MRHRIALALLLALTFLQRAFLYVLAFDLPFDSGSVGLMALHIAEGERPLFLYGFHYSGALLPHLVAILFSMFGVSWWTFVLPTLLLAVGTALMSYLLFRELFSPAAGLAAALCVAVPDWITSWYTMAPDCSYSPLFFLGTAALWLAVRLARRDLAPASEWAHVLALGLTAGLALWTHPLAVAYLIPAALLLLPMLIRRRCAPALLLKFLAGGVLMGLALLPYLLERPPAGGGGETGWQPVWAVIRLNAQALGTKVLPRMILWPEPGGPVAGRLTGGLLALGGGLYVLRLLTPSGRKDAAASALPLLFCALFLVLYLPHGKAAELAPRYVISFWTMVMFAMTAVTVGSRLRFIRIGGAAVLGLWAAYNVAGVALYASARHPRAVSTRAAFARLVDHAEAAGADHVLMVGEYFFETRGQSATFMARDRVRFVGADLERYAPSVRSAEAAPPSAYAVASGQAAALREALRRTGSRFEETPDDWAHLFHGVRPAPPAAVAAPPASLAVSLLKPLHGKGRYLVDRTRDSYVIGAAAGSGFVIDLGATRTVEGLALSPAMPEGHLLPASFLIEGTVDGMPFRELLRVRNAEPLCYPAGEAVYVRGGYGWLACRFDPVPVRRLRFTVPGGDGEAALWRVNEVFVFEHADEGPPGEAKAAAGAIAARLEERGVAFTACDRWLSAYLIEALPAGNGRWPAFPRLNDHYHLVGASPPAPRRTLSLSPGHAVAVAAALADEQEDILEQACGAGGVTAQREDFGPYTLFLFEGAGDAAVPELEWNGLLLLH